MIVLVTDILCSMHDSRVLSRSDLGREINQNPALLFPNSKYHLVGDSAFPSSRYVMPSFKRRYANTRRRLFYNARLNTFRCVVEHAFGSLKNLWRRLFYIKASIRKAVRIIASCFVLHNFIIVLFLPLIVELLTTIGLVGPRVSPSLPYRLFKTCCTSS